MSTSNDAGSADNSKPSPRMGSWPGSKLARARTHLGELHSRINAWQATAPFSTTATIADDRMSWRLRLNVQQQPPLVEWSTVAGDVIHNLRSALDAAVWEFATVDGAIPTKPKAVSFPVVTDPTNWTGAASGHLSEVPPDYVARIESVQPYNHTQGDQMSALSLLHALDIDDKHRAGITAAATPMTATHTGSIKFASDEAAARNTPPETIVTPQAITDGAVLIEQRTVDPIERVVGGFNVQLELRLDTPQGPQRLLETLSTLNQGVTNVLTVLYGGADTAPISGPEG